ncbi:hypothetical protein [Gordonia shandongensis]|uniref:hypothetical protein n=1 Tax=Gordonia shandongensis TaxID=376351 RepID=UPI000428192D|nr:hypothetical protein [Gordonia shandongensis]
MNSDSTPNGRRSSDTGFSFLRLVMYALGGGVAVLIVAVPVVMVLGRNHPTAALIVALGAVVLMIAVIALVSRRMTAGVQREIDARRAELAAKNDHPRK